MVQTGEEKWRKCHPKNERNLGGLLQKSRGSKYPRVS